MYRKNLVFAAACLGMLLFGIVFLSLGSVNNMLAERFKLDDVAIGTLTALLPFGILVGSLIFGPVVDRFGYRWMLVGASLIVGVALGRHGLCRKQEPGSVLCVRDWLRRRNPQRRDQRPRGRRQRRRARRETQFARRFLRHRRTGHAVHDCHAVPPFCHEHDRGGDRCVGTRASRVLPGDPIPTAEAAIRTAHNRRRPRAVRATHSCSLRALRWPSKADWRECRTIG